MICKKVIYTGQVQGVGFRYRTLQIAENFAISGYVKNLADGRVEVVAQGEADAVDQFLASIAERMERYIRDINLSDAPSQNYYGFSVTH